MVFDIFHFAILVCLLGGVLFAAGPIILAKLIAPNAKDGDLGIPYECGMRPLGTPWAHFGITYYVYALLFIAFDVDVLYLYPVAISYSSGEGWTDLVKLLLFLFFLILALVYFKAKGVFSWPRKIPVR